MTFALAHTFVFGPLDQGCQCPECREDRLFDAAPVLATALGRLVALIAEAASEGVVIRATHIEVLSAREALTQAGIIT
jgi:hypothetical protein